MRVLITGGMGFIGRNLTRRLLDDGHSVTAVDLPGADHPPSTLLGGARLAFHDILAVDDWADLLDVTDVVVHGAGIHQVDHFSLDPIRANEVNVTGTHRLLKAAAEHGVGRFVLLSSAKVYGHTDGAPSTETDLVAPAEPYALTKAVAEFYCTHFHEEAGIETTIVRPFSVYGPGQDISTGYIGALIEGVRRDRRIELAGNPEFSRDFVHVDTVVDICAAVVESDDPPPVINAGSGEVTSLATLVEHFEHLIGRPLRITYTTPRVDTLEHTCSDTTVSELLASPARRGLLGGLEETLRAHDTSAALAATPVALILAAGKGSRFGADRPKQLLDLLGRPVIVYALRQHVDLGHRVVLVVSESTESEVRSIVAAHLPDADITIVRGGVTRRESVLAAVAAIPADTPPDAPVILRNAASPNTPTDLLADCAEGIGRHDGMQAYVPSDKTTFVHADGNLDWLLARHATGFTVDPTVYRCDLIRRIATELARGVDGETTLDIARRLDADIAIVESPSTNIKLTRAIDLERLVELMTPLEDDPSPQTAAV